MLKFGQVEVAKKSLFSFKSTDYVSDIALVVGLESDRMSIFQPVSLAANLAFWPSRPIANES